MTVSPQQPTAELADAIVSGAYWQEAIDPRDNLDATARAEYDLNIMAAQRDTEAAQEISVAAMSLRGGGSFEPLESGSNFPEIPSGSRRIVRLVEDSLTVLTRGSSHYRTLRDIQRKTEEQEKAGEYPGFDALAEQAMDPSYLHVHPAMHLRSAGLRKAMHAARIIYYMKPVFNGTLGLCVNSIFLQTAQDLEHMRPEVIPAVPIGATYVRNNRISKIVRADLMEATGILWRDEAPKRPPSKKRSLAGALLPRLAPGFGK